MDWFTDLFEEQKPVDPKEEAAKQAERMKLQADIRKLLLEEEEDPGVLEEGGERHLPGAQWAAGDRVVEPERAAELGVVRREVVAVEEEVQRL